MYKNSSEKSCEGSRYLLASSSFLRVKRFSAGILHECQSIHIFCCLIQSKAPTGFNRVYTFQIMFHKMLICMLSCRCGRVVANTLQVCSRQAVVQWPQVPLFLQITSSQVDSRALEPLEKDSQPRSAAVRARHPRCHSTEKTEATVTVFGAFSESFLWCFKSSLKQVR